MDLYDIAIARKLSSGGGGGGSSDFSTAEVTIIGKEQLEGIEGAFVRSDGNLAAFIPAEELPSPIICPVPNNGGIFSAVYPLEGYSVSTSGNITDMGEGVYLITGDCTITIS